MTEVEKMRSDELTDMSAPELQVRFEHTRKLLARIWGLSTYDNTYRELFEELVPDFPPISVICPPFHCDCGGSIHPGEHVSVNANCISLDGAFVTIGSHTLIGPCTQICIPHHLMDYLERYNPKECAYPVIIGEDCWVGSGAVIYPEVTTSSCCVIGAGSVATRDTPDDCVAVDNPTHVIRRQASDG